MAALPCTPFPPEGLGIPVSLQSSGPLQAAAVAWRSQTGLQVTVLVKLSFSLLPGRAVLLQKADPLSLEELHHDGDRALSVQLPKDSAPFKRAPEVLLLGHAYAEDGKPAAKISCRLRVGSVDKSWEAWGPRTCAGEQVLVPELVARVPLQFEHTAGGPDSENPVGVLAPQFGDGSLANLPALQPRGFQPRAGAPLPCVGLGPIAESWPSRQRRLRAEDRAWLADPKVAILPQGFDGRFFSAAPADQQLSHPIRPDETLLLEGLSPSASVLETRLPGVAPKVWHQGAFGDAPVLVADTLVIDTDRQVASVIYRARVLVRPDEELRLRVGMARSGREVSHTDLETLEESAPPRFEAGLEPDAVRWLPAVRWLAAHVSAPGNAPESEAPEPDLSAETGEFAVRPRSGFFSAVIGEAAEEATWSEWMHDESSERLDTQRLDTQWLDTQRLDTQRLDTEIASGSEEMVGSDVVRSETRAEAARVVEMLSESSGDDTLSEAELRILFATSDDASERQLGRRLERYLAGEAPALPCALVVGRLTPRFDEAKALELLCNLVEPYAERERRLAAALLRGRQLLAHPVPGARCYAELLHEIESAATLLPLRTPDLVGELGRALLRGRLYEHVELFGSTCVPVDLEASTGSPLPCYVRLADALKFPLFKSFQAAAWVRVRPREVADERHSLALECLAVARVHG